LQRTAAEAIAALDAADGDYGIVLAAGWLNEEQRELDGIAVVVDQVQNRVVWIRPLLQRTKQCSHDSPKRRVFLGIM
jgi:hypothetical protein